MMQLDNKKVISDRDFEIGHMVKLLQQQSYGYIKMIIPTFYSIVVA